MIAPLSPVGARKPAQPESTQLRYHPASLKPPPGRPEPSHGLHRDTVQFSGASKAEQAQSAQVVDDILNQCDQQRAPERMTFRDFLIKTHQDPKRYIPTTSAYFLDAFAHYNGSKGPKTIQAFGETVPRHAIMSAPWNDHLNDPPKVYGHESTVNRLLEIVKNFKQQPNPDRAIAFFGPHGSGKSMIPKTIMEGLENFSKQDEGALWTYAFVFPDGQRVNPQSPEEAQKWMKTVSQQATLHEPEKIAAQLMANLNLNPIFILPPKQRIAFIQKLKQEQKLEPDFNVDYYLKSNLEGYGQKILNQLHRLYENDPKHFSKALEHVQVERFHLSGQEFRGLVEVPAARNPDAVLRETPASGSRNLPAIVQNIGNRTLDGLMPKAHRGIFYLDDFGRSGAPQDHLLMPVETGEVTLQEAYGGPGITKEKLDFIPMLSVNPEVIERARQNGTFEALEQRMLFVPVPWERRYQVEKQILQPIMNRAEARGKKITPHTLDAFSLWVAMTRMFPVNPGNPIYKTALSENKDFASAIKKLTPLKKALLYQGEALPGVTHEETQALQENLKRIANEHTQSLGETEFSLYEGGLGLSNRSAANLLKQLIAKSDKDTISFIDVFENVAHYAQNAPQFEKRRENLLKERNQNMNFPSALSLLKEVEAYTGQAFMSELKSALGMYEQPEVYTRRIQQYAAHIEAFRDGKAVPEAYRQHEDPNPDRQLIKDFENLMLNGRGTSESQRKDYRNSFLTRAIEWEPTDTEEENVSRIYRDEGARLRKQDEERNQQYLSEFRNTIKVLLKNPKALASQKKLPAQAHTQIRIEKALQQLEEKGYNRESLPRILDWALEKRYISDPA